MGNQFQTCCTDIRDTTNEINTYKKDEGEDDPYRRAKGHVGSLKSTPLTVQKFEEKKLENQNNPYLINRTYTNETPNDNYIQNNKKLQVNEFKPIINLISEFLVNVNSQNPYNELIEYISEKILETRASKNLNEIYNQDFSSYLNQNNFRNNDIIELPAVYLDKEKKDEIYEGSWIIIRKDIQKNEEIKNLTNYIKFHGYGIFIGNDETVQEGIFFYGELDGPGKRFTKNGDTLIGNFEKGELNNKGVFVDYAGDIYKGDFRNNLMEGNGEEKFIDGSCFKGEYKNSKKNGQGKFVWPDNSFYEGELIDNLFHGHGLYQWASGLRYEGLWEKGLMEGEGILKTKNGDYYEGEFKNNKKDGFGLFCWKENKYYLGYWKQGVQHGDGKFYKEGKVMVGNWQNGKFSNHVDEADINFPQKKFKRNVSF
jgi:hypothetical protein